jgi:integrase
MDEAAVGAVAQQRQKDKGETGVEQLDLFGMPVAGMPVASAPAAPRPAAPRPAAPDSASVAARTVAASPAAPKPDAPRDAPAASASLWHDEPTAPPAPATPDTAKPKRRARDVLAAAPSADVLAVAGALPPQVHLGTSSWSFPGWSGIVYGDDYSNSKLSRDGLTAYGAHPLLRTVSMLPHRSKRGKPYLYTEEEISHLMHAAKALPPSDGLRGRTYSCLFGLIAVTGLRISEALALQRGDVDLQRGLLTIRNTKFQRSRLVPLHPSACEALSQYAKRRDAYLDHAAAANFLVSERGQALKAATVRRTFRELSRQIGLRGPEDRTGPRLHDFRHRMATETLLRCYRSGDDVERCIPVLSTFLGHTRASETYWYLSACPELMDQAVRRLEQHWEVPL